VSRKKKQDEKRATADSAGANDEPSRGFTEEERAAMKERARELKAEKRGGSRTDRRAAGEAEVLAKIAEMEDEDRAMAERLHALVRATAPELSPKTWYGMPAYARGKDVVCFFQSARKFKSRYATLGFSDKASLDEGSMWPTAFALQAWTPAVEERVAALVERALGEE